MKLQKLTSGTIVALFLVSMVLNIMPVMAEPMELAIVSDATVEWSDDGTSWDDYAIVCWIYPGWPEIPGATWIWRTEFTDPLAEYTNVPLGGWYFRKVFNIPDTAYTITGFIEITADNAYELYINGNFIGGDGLMDKNGEDPVSVWQSIEMYPISNELQPGENTILVRALNQGDWGTSETNPAGLIFKATITYMLPGPMPHFSDILAMFSLGIVAGAVLIIKRRPKT